MDKKELEDKLWGKDFWKDFDTEVQNQDEQMLLDKRTDYHQEKNDREMAEVMDWLKETEPTKEQATPTKPTEQPEPEKEYGWFEKYVERPLMGGLYEVRHSVSSLATGVRSMFEEGIAPEHSPEEIADKIDYFDRTLSSQERSEMGQRVSDLVKGGMSTKEAYSKSLVEQVQLRSKNLPAEPIREALKKVETAKVLGLPEEYQQSSSGFIEDVIRGIGTSALPMATMAVNPIAGAALTYGQIEGATFKNITEGLKAEHPEMTTEQINKRAFGPAHANAAMQMPLETAGNLLKLKAVFGSSGFRKLMTNAVETFIGEGITEALQEYPEQVTTMWAMNPDLSKEEFIDFVQDRMGQITKEAGYAGLVGGTAGLVTAGAGATMVNQVQKLVSPKQQEINQQKMVEKQELQEKVTKGEEISAAEEKKIVDKERAELLRKSPEEMTEKEATLAEEMTAETKDEASIATKLSELGKEKIKLEAQEQELRTERAKEIAAVKPENQEWTAEEIAKGQGVTNINFNRLQTTDQIKGVIQKVGRDFSEQIDPERRGVQTHEVTQALANDLGMTAEQLIQRRRGEAFNAEEALAARQIMVTSAANVVRLTKELKEADIKDPLKEYELRKAISAHTAIQAHVQGMTAEAGRALQSFRIKAAETDARVLQGINEELLNMNMNQVPIDKIINYIEDASLKGPDKVNAAIKKAQQVTTFDRFLTVWINGLLSGPTTHAVNTLSNSMTTGLLVGERTIAAVSSKLRTSLKKSVPQTINQDVNVNPDNLDISFGEVGAMLHGLMESITENFKALTPEILRALSLRGVSQDLRKASKAENQIKALDGKRNREYVFSDNLSDWLNNAALAIGNIINLPSDALAVSDALFYNINYQAQRNALAYRIANSKGGTVEEIAAEVERIKNNEIEYDVDKQAKDFGEYATFTNNLDEFGRKMQTALGHYKAAKLIVPFFRTPANILKFTFDRMPLLNIASSRIRADLKAGGARRDLAIAKISVSMVFGTMAAGLAASGAITGSGPADPKKRQILMRQGWQPYSIKIGDTYYNYGRLEPVGMTFGTIADAIDIIGQCGEEDADKVITAAMISISQNALSKTWLKGLSETLHFLNNPDDYRTKSFVNNLTTSMLPYSSLIKTIERNMDPTQRATYTLLEHIKSKIPGWSQSLPPRRNLWGEEIVLQGGLGPDFISPIYTHKDTFSNIDKELYRLDMPVGMPRRTITILGEPVELTPQQYDDYIVLQNSKIFSGKTLKEFLNYTVTQDGAYKALPDEHKRDLIKAYVSRARGYARSTMTNRILRDKNF